MRYHIDTIPVWDAYHAGGECPLCDLKEKNEEAYLESFLGASVMEPDVRIEVNEKGFCGPHFAKMIVRKNRLGLALMTHTHLQQTISEMQPPGDTPRRFGRKRTQTETPPQDSCVICERLSDTMNRYAYTVLHLWKTDKTFEKLFDSSKGLCVPHYRKLTQMAPEALGGRADAFLQRLYAIQKENLERIEKELEWFTLKFDYRNADAPWGESRDALERAINKLSGKYV